MPSGLTKEHYIVIPANLAATIGLEESVMAQIIGDLQRFSSSSARVLTIPQTKLSELTPFWDDMKRRSVLMSLQAKGVLEVTYSGNNIVIATPDRAAPQAQPIRRYRSTNQKASGTAVITSDWQPRNSTYETLMQEKGIPKSFASEQLTEFRLYWQDRNVHKHSWDSTFADHVIKRWLRQPPAKSESATFDAKAANNQTMSNGWQPSQDAVEILTRSGVTEEFIQSAVPEFILYWRERGDSLKTWNSKFVAHIRRQWARIQSAREYDTEPHRIASKWQPSEDVYDIIAMANIDRNFASQQIPNFVLYWQETNQLHNSWNSKFLQHVKYQWARQHQLNNENANQSTGRPDSRSFVEKHTDTSWANDL